MYYRTYKNVNRTTRHTTAKCCAGWMHVPGQEGCQRANCTPDLCHNGGYCQPDKLVTKNEICHCPLGFQGARCQYGG
ncbi:unnamed protein product [Gongylonema pulchrum]|uniref:EGF-like domain-containing protein n=1 Tax=Gongylonema pulchrum TaxID=637853 RepID=A0A183DJE1_9BILA|nr:unnamed protein product [Gongylonema pulchrum]